MNTLLDDTSTISLDGSGFSSKPPTFDIKQAVAAFLDDGYGYGSEVKSDTLYRRYLDVQPQMVEYDSFEMPPHVKELLARLGAFEAELLNSHDMLLMAKGTGIRRIVEPNEQGEASINKFQKELKGSMSKLNGRLDHVNHDRLTDSEAAELTDQRIYRDALKQSLRLSTRKDGQGVKRKRFFKVTT